MKYWASNVGWDWVGRQYGHADYFRICNSEMSNVIQTNMTLSQIATAISKFGDDMDWSHMKSLEGWKNYVPWKKALEEGGYVSVYVTELYIHTDFSLTSI